MKDTSTKLWEEQARLLWFEYCAARDLQAGSERRERVLRVFRSTVAEAWRQMAGQAGRAHAALEFTAERLQVMALGAVDAPCVWCGELMGVDSLGIVWRKPLGRRGGTRDVGLANVAVCCDRCAAAKGSLSEEEWLDVIAALRAADPVAARETVDAMAAGRKVGRAATGGGGSSHRGGRCG